MKPVEITVPATSANLGPGFDCLGLALDLVNTVKVEYTPSRSEVLLVSFTGDEEHLLDPADNLLCAAYRRWGTDHGVELPGVRFSVQNRIPIGRGLGASAASVVAGLAAAAHASEAKAPLPEIVRLSTLIEGHPDNCVAAAMGGMTAGFLSGDRVHALHVANHLLLGVSLFIPHDPLLTVRARAALPVQVPLADAVFDLGRLAFLVTALIWGRWETIGPAMEDHLHQPYREALIPALASVINAAREAGAYGAALSGGGPTVIALGPVETAATVAEAMRERAEALNWRGQSMVTRVREHGVQVKDADEG